MDTAGGLPSPPCPQLSAHPPDEDDDGDIAEGVPLPFNAGQQHQNQQPQPQPAAPGGSDDGPQPYPYQKLSIYETKARVYIVGYCKHRRAYAILKFSKQEPQQLDVVEDPGSYSLEEVNAILRQIHLANTHLGGLQLVTHVRRGVARGRGGRGRGRGRLCVLNA